MYYEVLGLFMAIKKSLCSPGMYNLVGETDDKQIHEK